MYNTPASRPTDRQPPAPSPNKSPIFNILAIRSSICLQVLILSRHHPLRNRVTLSHLKIISLILLRRIQRIILVREALVAQQTIIEVTLGGESNVVIARVLERQGVTAVGGDGVADCVTGTGVSVRQDRPRCSSWSAEGEKNGGDDVSIESRTYV